MKIAGPRVGKKTRKRATSSGKIDRQDCSREVNPEQTGFDEFESVPVAKERIAEARQRDRTQRRSLSYRQRRGRLGLNLGVCLEGFRGRVADRVSRRQATGLFSSIPKKYTEEEKSRTTVEWREAGEKNRRPGQWEF